MDPVHRHSQLNTADNIGGARRNDKETGLPSRRRARQSHGRPVVGNRPRRPNTLFNTLRAPGHATTYTGPNSDSDSDSISNSVRGDYEDYDGGSNSDPPRRDPRGRRVPSPASIDDVSRRDHPPKEIDDEVQEHRRMRRPSQQHQQKPQQQQRYRHIYHHAGALPEDSACSAVRFRIDGGRGKGDGHERGISEGEEPALEKSRWKSFVPTVKRAERAGADDTPGRLAARLADLEARLSSEGYVEAGDDVGKRTSYIELGAVSGGRGDAGGAMSVAECDVQRAALRNALLLEERGLQLERAEVLLRQKTEEETALRKELHRLSVVSVTGKVSQRRLSEAEDQIETLLERSEVLEELASDRLARLEEERLARSSDQKVHDSELERVRSESAEALARERTAEKSSRALCVQMSELCRQMKTAAEKAERRSTASEEKVNYLEKELSCAEARSMDGEREVKLLRVSLTAARKEAEDRAHVCSKDRDAAVVLRGLLEDRETRLREAEQDASEAEGKLKEAAEEFDRNKKALHAMKASLERSRGEIERLRSRLEAAGDLAAAEACRAKEAQEAEKSARLQLRSASEREAVLLSEKDSQALKIHELNGLLAKLSSDLSDGSKVSRERLVQLEMSSRAASEAERRLEEQKCHFEDETARIARTSREAAQAAEEAAMARVETSKTECERLLKDFQESMVFTLQRVDDAVVDALRSVGKIDLSDREGFAREGNTISASPPRRHHHQLRRKDDHDYTGPELGCRAGLCAAPCDAPGGKRPEAGAEEAREGFCFFYSSAPGNGAGLKGGDVEETKGGEAVTIRLERTLTRIMRRLEVAKEFRSWVACEMERTGVQANDTMRELRWSCEGCLGRLKEAEGKLVRLQEQARYGGRRAALEAREACYEKIHTAEKEKWSLREYLAVEERVADNLRIQLRQLQGSSKMAAASAQEEYSAVRLELENERALRLGLQRKAELLGGRAAHLEEKLSALVEQTDRYRSEKLGWQEERDRLQMSHENLVSRLEEEKLNSEEARKRALDHHHSEEFHRKLHEEKMAAREEEEARLEVAVKQERVLRENEVSRMSALLERERTARDHEIKRLGLLLEEERRARLEENALGEVVLREVRETQSLIGEGSPLSARSGSDDARGRFRPIFDGTNHGEARERQVVAVNAPLTLRRQASTLEKIVDDTTVLIKLTGAFYDRYSETHRCEGLVSGGGAQNSTIATSCPTARYFARSDGDEGPASSAPATYSRRSNSHPLHGEQPSGVDTSNGASYGREGEGRSRWGFSKRAVGVTGRAPYGRRSLKELDQRCYDLLESNARLCLRLQELGLEYTGLTRDLLVSGEDKRLRKNCDVCDKSSHVVEDLDSCTDEPNRNHNHDKRDWTQLGNQHRQHDCHRRHHRGIDHGVDHSVEHAVKHCLDSAADRPDDRCHGGRRRSSTRSEGRELMTTQGGEELHCSEYRCSYRSRDQKHCTDRSQNQFQGVWATDNCIQEGGDRKNPFGGRVEEQAEYHRADTCGSHVSTARDGTRFAGCSCDHSSRHRTGCPVGWDAEHVDDCHEERPKELSPDRCRNRGGD